MKKIFIVEASKVIYDQYESLAVVAFDEKEAFELVEKSFEEDQLPLTIKEIDLNESGIFHSSFNAG